MSDPRVTRLPQVLVDYATDIQPKQKVAIAGSALAAPLIEAVYVRTLERGGLFSGRPEATFKKWYNRRAYLEDKRPSVCPMPVSKN